MRTESARQPWGKKGCPNRNLRGEARGFILKLAPGHCTTAALPRCTPYILETLIQATAASSSRLGNNMFSKDPSCKQQSPPSIGVAIEWAAQKVVARPRSQGPYPNRAPPRNPRAPTRGGSTRGQLGTNRFLSLSPPDKCGAKRGCALAFELF